MRYSQRLQRILGVGCRLCYFANRRPRLRSRYSEEPSGLLPIPRAGAAKQVRHCRSRRVLIFLGPLLRDFLKMWTFYVEVIEVTADNQDNLPKTILSVGQIPTEAPEKEFIAEQSNHDFEDDYGSNFNNDFESLDDIDFDQY